MSHSMIILFETVSTSNGDFPLDLGGLFGKMGARRVTIEEPKKAKQAEESSTSSWTGTLFKGALIGGALLGAAYVGYRYGFFDGANGVIDEMKKYAQQQMGQTAQTESQTFSGAGVGFSPLSGDEALNTVAQDLVHASQDSDVMDVNVFEQNVENFRREFVGRAYSANSLMNVQMPNMTAASEAVSNIADKAWDTLSTPVGNAYYTARNEALIWMGSTAAAVAVPLLAMAKCIGAVRGYR